MDPQPRTIKTRRAAGFTLIELMISLVIVTLLAMVAIPSYTSFVDESRRADALSALTQTASLMEQHFTENNTYTANLTLLGFANAGVNQTQDQFYNFQVLAATAGCALTNCYVLQAQPRNGSAQWGDDFHFQLHSDGSKLRRVCPKDVCSGTWVTGWKSH